MNNNNNLLRDRILSIDIFRGITIAGMICVNNPGSEYVYVPFAHSQWAGLTPTDLVFPLFMFLMGLSIYLSLSKYGFSCNHKVLIKIIRRTLLIWIIGIILNAFFIFCQHKFSISDVRILGVLPRLAICYGVVSLIAVSVKYKHIFYIIGSLLIVYLIILLIGNGFEYNETNILSIVDRNILGINHMYNDNGIDPEGILSTIPAIAHTLIGFCCGKIIKESKPIDVKIERLFIIGGSLLFGGYLLSYGCPVIKKIWSPSYVLVTCGAAFISLALLMWIIDVNHHYKWSNFFHIFGVNPLFLYVLSEALTVILYAIGLHYDEKWISIHKIIYDAISITWMSQYLTSLIFALLIVCFNWCVGAILYKKNIFIKI